MTRPPVPGRSRGVPPPPWDDARVGAAYRAAFGRRAPAGLDREVFASVAAGRSPVRRSWRTSLPVLPGRLGRRGALAGVAVVLVATAGIAGLGGLAGIGPFADREDPPSGRFTLSAAPGGLVTELPNFRRWRLRGRYYAQLKGGFGYLRVVPGAAEFRALP